jgi:tetratricopeptide (TPR) repeat protein
MSIALAALVAALTGTTPAVQAAPADWTALTGKLTQAADAGNLSDLKSARAAVLKQVVTPSSAVPPAIAHYTLAYVDYRLAVDQRVPGAEQHDFADEAERHVRDAIRANEKFAEAHALLSAILGLKIAWAASVEAKMSLGPESGAALDRALALEPDNPRVLLIEGIGFYHRPVEYGGDPKQAEALFRRAADRLDATRDAPWPNWGRFDAHVWLGQALARRGDAAGARAEYDKALAVSPGSAWVRDVLIPALGKKIVA